MLELSRSGGHPPGDALSENLLLASLDAADGERLQGDLEHVPLPVGKVLFEPDAPMSHAYFVDAGLVSVVSTMAEGTVEVGAVGREGLVGVPILLYADRMPARTFVQVAGEGRRIEAERLRSAVSESRPLERTLLRYVQAFIEQVSQTAACNRLHTLEERCARWLLMTQDRVQVSVLPITQQILSQMLGVHRPAVTLAAGALQKAGLIRYTRGKVTIVDRARLEEAACACYGITRRSLERLVVEGRWLAAAV